MELSGVLVLAPERIEAITNRELMDSIMRVSDSHGKPEPFDVAIVKHGIIKVTKIVEEEMNIADHTDVNSTLSKFRLGDNSMNTFTETVKVSVQQTPMHKENTKQMCHPPTPPQTPIPSKRAKNMRMSCMYILGEHLKDDAVKTDNGMNHHKMQYDMIIKSENEAASAPDPHAELTQRDWSVDFEKGVSNNTDVIKSFRRPVVYIMRSEYEDSRKKNEEYISPSTSLKVLTNANSLNEQLLKLHENDNETINNLDNYCITIDQDVRREDPSSAKPHLQTSPPCNAVLGATGKKWKELSFTSPKKETKGKNYGFTAPGLSSKRFRSLPLSKSTDKSMRNRTLGPKDYEKIVENLKNLV